VRPHSAPGRLYWGRGFATWSREGRRLDRCPAPQCLVTALSWRPSGRMSSPAPGQSSHRRARRLPKHNKATVDIRHHSRCCTLDSQVQHMPYPGCLDTLAFKAVNGFVPSYLSDLCRPVSTVVSRRLHSAARGDLIIDTSVSDFKQHSFSAAALKAWNKLLDSQRNIRTVDSFKSDLKTFLFNS